MDSRATSRGQWRSHVCGHGDSGLKSPLIAAYVYPDQGLLAAATGDCGLGQSRLPTFRFSGRATSRHPPSGQIECSRHPFSSLLDCPGRGRRVKAKPQAVASRALTRRPRSRGRLLSRRTGTRP